jgi:hypothetical protein
MEKVNLTSSERDYLNEFTKFGNHKVREVNRAYMLLWLDQGLTSEAIASLLPIERTAYSGPRKNISTVASKVPCPTGCVRVNRANTTKKSRPKLLL